MNYRFDVEGNVIEVLISCYSPNSEVVIYENGQTYKRNINRNEKGDFFLFKNKKIYLDSFKAYSLNKLIEKIENGEHVLDSDLCQTIIKEGTNNIILTCPLNPIEKVLPKYRIAFYNEERYDEVDCIISESVYKIRNNNKIDVLPLVNGYGRTTYYIEDLLSLIKYGKIKIRKKELSVA